MKCLVVDTKKVRRNIALVREKAGGCAVYGVLKGNGYGLGLLRLAHILRDEGIGRFAVTDPQDAVKLRDEGFIDEDILVMRSTTDREDIERILDSSATATVGSYEAAVALGGIASERACVAEAHVEIDTGMGRYGFLPSETDKIASIYTYLPSVAVTGIYTHYSKAFTSRKATAAQCAAFSGVVAELQRMGLETGTVHASNTAALFKCGVESFDAVRIGSAFTGRVPFNGTSSGFDRVGYIECPICEMRWLPKGITVGYGGLYRTKRPTKIAVIPVGYADGFCTEKSRDSFRLRDGAVYALSMLKKTLLTRKPHVRIGNQRARILGHVGMSHTVCDVTNIECSTGTVVTFDVNPILCGSIARKYV